MHTVNTIEIDAPAEVVFVLAAAVEEWPALLTHYRSVQVLDSGAAPEDGAVRRVRMAASRSGIPVSWTALQVIDERALEIRYRHTAGVTLGMDVVWRLLPAGERTSVRIEHDLDSPRWWLRNRVTSTVVGRVFVVSIADRTLRGIKRHAESHSVSRIAT